MMQEDPEESISNGNGFDFIGCRTLANAAVKLFKYTIGNGIMSLAKEEENKFAEPIVTINGCGGLQYMLPNLLQYRFCFEFVCLVGCIDSLLFLI